MESAFERVVQHIFTNWTALKLAVDHSMGGSNSQQVATEFIKYTVQYCLNESDVDVDSIQDVLEDVMDQEFNTICEDDSTREIAVVLFKFVRLIKQNDLTTFEEEYQKLPLSTGVSVSVPDVAESETLDESPSSVEEQKQSATLPMEEDSEWTKVESKRRH